MATKSGRTISHLRKLSIKDVLIRWEFLLIVIFHPFLPTTWMPITCLPTSITSW